MYIKCANPEKIQAAADNVNEFYQIESNTFNNFMIKVEVVGLKGYYKVTPHLKWTHGYGHAHSGASSIHKGKACGHILQHFLHLLPDGAEVYWHKYKAWKSGPKNHVYEYATQLQQLQYSGPISPKPCHCDGILADMAYLNFHTPETKWIPLTLPDGTTHPLDTEENHKKYVALDMKNGGKKCPDCDDYHVHAEPEEVDYFNNVTMAKITAKNAAKTKALHATMGPLELDDEGFKLCHGCGLYHLIPTNEEMDDWLSKQEVKP